MPVKLDLGESVLYHIRQRKALYLVDYSTHVSECLVIYWVVLSEKLEAANQQVVAGIGSALEVVLMSFEHDSSTLFKYKHSYSVAHNPSVIPLRIFECILNVL